MRLCVTGGAGFIGANFVRYWSAQHPDDRIVVSGLMQARPGAKVRPEEQGAKPAQGGAAGAPQQAK